MSVKVKIKILPGGKMPERKTDGAAAYDCYARKTVILENAPKVIPLGFKIQIPNGFHAEIYPRSSIGLKTALRMANSVGIIDSDYTGEVGFVGESKIGKCVVRAGERIAQLIIKRNVEFEFEEVAELSPTSRGDGGFGSTGTW